MRVQIPNGNALSQRHVIIGTAGHVDHGKTTLIRTLTGTDTDRLAEEKARGMTIDLGFAFLTLPNGIRAGIVDVPGHERFVKNMLAGAGGVDVALLVVAADEGPMPQTREHLDILMILGVSHGVVALTKCDRADDDLRALAELLTRDALIGTTLQDAPIVPISAETGFGLNDLRNALASAAHNAPLRDRNSPFRLPIDRVFSLPGVGTVATGTLVCGTMRVGDAVETQPQNLPSKARTLQTHGARVEEAVAGMRVAVNLPGIEVGQIERGAVLSPPGALSATSLMDVGLMLLSSALSSGRTGGRTMLAHRDRVRVHLGTGEVLARVLLMAKEGEGTAANETTSGANTIETTMRDVPAQLLLETPAAPARGERFVLRTYSPLRTIGGGVVLDAHPPRRYRRGDAAAVALFDARAESSNMTNVTHAALSREFADASVADIAAQSGLEPDLAVVALETLVDEGRATILPDGRYLSDASVARIRQTAERTLATYHRQNPLRTTMPREGLRAPLAKAASVRDFGALLMWLTMQGVVVQETGGGVRLPTHAVVLSPSWEQAASEMLAVYQSARFSPPNPMNFQANYPNDVHVRSILDVLTERGELVRIADDLYLHAEAVEEARRAVLRIAQTKPDEITVGNLRDSIASSRKIVLPLLEYFDAQRFTRRIGDARVLVTSAVNGGQTGENG